MPNVKKTSNHARANGSKNAEPTPEPCPVCSTALASGAKFCSQCGRKLVSDKDTDKKSNASAKEPANSTAIQNSSQDAITQPGQPVESQLSSVCSCGQELPDEAQFCYRCGSPVNQKESEYMIVCRGQDNKDIMMNVTQQEFTIGKSANCDLAITDDDYVSRRHACLVESDGSVLLKDLNSSNGTFLRVQKTTVLEHGDEFLIGTRLIRLEKVQP